MLLILFALMQIGEGLVIPEDGYSYPVEARTMFELKRIQKIDEKDPRVQEVKKRITELKQTIEQCIQKECKEHNVQQHEVEEIMKYANCAEKCYKRKDIRKSTKDLKKSPDFLFWVHFMLEAEKKDYVAQDQFSRSLLKGYALEEWTIYNKSTK